METPLTDDERRILALLLEGDDPGLAVLRAQAGRAAVAGRKWTDSGYFADFTVPDDAPRLPDRNNLALSDARGEVADFECGFILFVRDGALHHLECFAVSENYFPRGARFLRVYRSTDEDHAESEEFAAF